MSNEVYANNMEVSCKAAAGKSICAFPDVCFTPPQTPATPPGVPIPYPNTGLASDCTDGSTSVKISGKEVMLKNKSYFKKSTGDEAGCAPKKGIINSKITGKVYFNAWSMDVKIEGENVVRNLDLTTHNHGSMANEAVPWPYQDAVAMNVKGHPCKGMAKDIEDHCADANDYGRDCCKARKCMMAPYSPNSCCNAPSTSRQMTPHHLLPSKEFVAHAGRGKPDPATNYVSKEAPCVCLKGSSHAKHTEHGKVGCNYTVEKAKWFKDPANLGKKYTLKEGIKTAAKSAQGKINAGDSKGCDEKCMARQLALGHSRLKLKVKTNDPLPRSKQHA